MKYPQNLSKGGTIGFVAPSFGCQIEPYKSAFGNALKKFEKSGYKLDLGSNCYAAEGIGISNLPEKCAEELMEYFCDKDTVDVLISCGGGELMCEILPFLDFAKISRSVPKWYMGYSDNTNFTYLLATLADTASVYGPCAAAFGMEPWHQSLRDALGLLTGEQNEVKGYPLWEKESLKTPENPLLPYHVTQKRVTRAYIGKNEADTGERLVMKGRLLGGCMDCLVTLLGTRFDKTREFVEHYKEDGILWFLEACDLNVFGIRRAMWQMEQAGWFEHVKGFLIGRPYCFGQEMMGLDAYQAVLEVAGKRKVPVLMDLDLGHLAPMMPLIVGSVGEVTYQDNEVSVKMHKI